MTQLYRFFSTLLAAAPLLGTATTLAAEEIRVAAASSFRNTGRMLAEQFNAAHSDQVVMMFGASGKLNTQINKGAVFDILLSADAEAPRKLEAEGRAISGTRFTFAVGKLVLWSSKAGLVDNEGAILQPGSFTRLAIADPRQSPYGKAGRQVLQNLQLEKTLQARLVLSKNLEQVFQSVSSGKVDLGFVSNAQLAQSIWGSQGSRWDLPQSLYEPLELQAILINDKLAAQAFMAFLSSPAARQLIQSHGYALP